MPEGTVSFDVRAPGDRVWAFLSDMRKVGSCVPGVQSVDIHDERRAPWNPRMKIGPLSQLIRVETENIEMIPPSRAKFRGVADNVDMTGTIVLEPKGGGTKVRYQRKAQKQG